MPNFLAGGYEVIFIDIDKKINDELNRRKCYNVVIKSEVDEIIEVSNISGILASDEDSIKKAIVNSSLIATSVGKNALLKIIPLIAKGINARYDQRPDSPIDIILAGNIRDACQQLQDSFKKILPQDFPVEEYIGLVETSIGKMVPIMPKEIEETDPLLVYAEPYNTLILEKDGFKNPILDVKGLSPKQNIKAWVDRKAFIHNLGHVAAACYGYLRFPEKKYLYQVLENEDVRKFTFDVMEQSADVLLLEYPSEFTKQDLINHIEDLISRFRNKALGDTVYRVGSDLKRKLSRDDRVVGAIMLAQKHNCTFDKIQETLVYGLLFRQTDNSKTMFPGDQELAAQIGGSLKNILTGVCGFDLKHDKQVIEAIEDLYLLKLIALQNV